MNEPVALLDSNVVIACLAEEHEHHAASLALLIAGESTSLAVTAHSCAETYATLTRDRERALFGFTASEARAALESVRAAVTLIGLTPSQTFDTICRYAEAGGIGSRLYDALFGEAAAAHGIPTIVTWNTRHMVGLFPKLTVVNPTRYLRLLRSA